MTTQATVSHLLHMLENQEQVIEFSQQQYFSPIYSREWYKTQIARSSLALSEYSWASSVHVFAIPLMLILGILLIFCVILVYFLPPLHRFAVFRQPENPRVRIDFAQREITFWNNQACIQKLELNFTSSMCCNKQPLFFYRDNHLIILSIYDKKIKQHIMWEMETATLFGKSDAKLIQQVYDLTEKISQKLHLTLYRDV